MRSFATALVLCALAGTAGAQCNSSKSAWVDTAFVQELYVSPQQPAAAARHTAGPVVTAAVLGPKAAPTSQTKVAQPASEFSSFDAAALYAAIALMAAIALRRFIR